MEFDDHLQRHFDSCDDHSRHLKAEGKWLWSESPEGAGNDRIDEQDSTISRSDLSATSIAGIQELVDVLRGLHRRLTDEGYELVNGQYRPRQPKEYETKDEPRCTNPESDQTR